MAFTNDTLINYFKQRMVELYDRNTLDTYAVRTCNTMSMFCEAKEMLNGWLIGNVKRGETVGLCMDELIKLLSNDEWIDDSVYNRAKLKTHLEAYAKGVKQIKDTKDKKEKDYNDARYTLFLVNQYISQNDARYLISLLDAVEQDLLTVKTYDDDQFSDTISRLDAKLSLLATELLRRGYSKIFLYQYFTTIKRNVAGLAFSNIYTQLRNRLGNVKFFNDVVIIRLHFKSKTIPQMADMSEEVPAEYQDAMSDVMKGFTKKSTGNAYYIVSVKAPDSNAALQKARLQLSQALDRNDMGVLEIANKGLVAYKDNNNWTLHWEQYYDLNKKSPRGGNIANPLPGIMQRIETSKHKEVKERLNTALRHLRVGDDQEEIEQRFLNYWIGLEFLFASPRSADSTFSRLKEKFPKLKTLYYLKRNVLSLDKRLIGKGLIAANKSMGTISEQDMDTAFSAATEELLKYRIKSMKSHLHNREKVKNYLSNHIQNLEWHLSRIYHLRNELVHEAAIKQSIVGVTGNLRDYLVFMLNLLLDYCDSQMANHVSDPITMDDFFWQNELLWENLTPEYKKEEFMKIQLPTEYVR